MKKNLYAMSVMVLMVVLSFLSCSKDADGYSGDVELGNNKLTIRTKAVSSGTTTMTVATPINIYVFDSQDKCIAQKTIETETDKADMKLQAGTYKVYAVAGASSADYSLPKKVNATPQSVVALIEGKQHSDLMAAANDITLVDGEDADLTLLMQRKVLMLTAVNITDVPDDVTGISATLGSLYENITLTGDYSGEQGSQTINLSKQSSGSTWTADCNLFLFPSVGNPSVTFTFKTSDGKTKTFTYASQKPLVANYKVSINVNYLKVKEPTLKCSINGVDWAGTDVWNFDADERNFSITGGDDTGGTTVDDGNVPIAGTLYKGCYVLKTEKSGNKTLVTVVAPKGKKSLTYENGDETSIKNAVENALKELPVSGIDGWRLPTLEELNTLSENIDKYRNILSSNMENIFTTNQMIYFENDKNEIKCLRCSDKEVLEPISGMASMYLRPFTTLIFTD